ncbi:hypothetical protein [Roseovarius sp. 2305UL8-3]|uniref:hypothetical protein n=1 Tax=Roseovarius conchicola TaxID=3121636 RepID=UPI003526D68E
MTEQVFGTIAALEFCVLPRQGFEDIVEDLDISFQPTGLTRRTLIWDGDDIAIIERDALRILLGWLPPEFPGAPGYLVMAVGKSPNNFGVEVGVETCQFIKELLLAHLASYLTARRVLHKDTDQQVDSELMDDVAEILAKEAAQSWPAQGAANEQDEASGQTASPLDSGSKDKNTAEFIEAEFHDLGNDEDCSLPKRLTIYTLGATMLLYTPPVGASLLVYATLRDFAPADPLALTHTSAA